MIGFFFLGLIVFLLLVWVRRRRALRRGSQAATAHPLAGIDHGVYRHRSPGRIHHKRGF